MRIAVSLKSLFNVSIIKVVCIAYLREFAIVETRPFGVFAIKGLILRTFYAQTASAKCSVHVSGPLGTDYSITRPVIRET